jgi:toxin FitB
MIVLDTNVISEFSKPIANPYLMEWVNRQILANLYITAVTVAEIRFGILSLPVGKRRDAISEGFVAITKLYEGRILAFDQSAAEIYAPLARNTRRLGRTLSVIDGYIAAIAASRGFTLATKNKNILGAIPFETVNPWK